MAIAFIFGPTKTLISSESENLFYLKDGAYIRGELSIESILKETHSWQIFDWTKQLKNDLQNGFVWHRFKLPSTKLSHPVLFIGNVDQEFELYMEDKLIFKFGNFGIGGAGGKFQGFPWHMIEIPPNYMSKTIYIKA
jgi:hypothetical protein